MSELYATVTFNKFGHVMNPCSEIYLSRPQKDKFLETLERLHLYKNPTHWNIQTALEELHKSLSAGMYSGGSPDQVLVNPSVWSSLQKSLKSDK